MRNTEPIREIAESPKYDLEELTDHYHRNLNRNVFNYLESRGIGQETIEQYKIGFESGRIGFYVRENSLAEYFEDRIIVPLTAPDGTIVDLIGRSLDNREPLYKSLYGVEDILFNEKAILNSDEVIFCSEILDALTLIQAELPAVCMLNTLLFKEGFADKFADKRVFLCLSNDENGRRESVRIEELLKGKAKEIYVAHLPEKIRTVNELFAKKENPLDSFRNILSDAVEKTVKAPFSPDAKYLTIFNEEYAKRHQESVVKAPSGIAGLDKLLNGGFSSGLYLLAGPPNVGKSTLMKQMADHMAMEKHPVVFATWDMTPFELWAKSVARCLGKPPHDVLDAKIEPDSVREANQTFSEISQMLWTMECSLQTEPNDICRFVEKIAVQAGRPPVVFIDHFHRLVFSFGKKEDETEKERQEFMIYRLKQWAREWNAPIITALAVEDNMSDAIGQELDVSIQTTADGIIWIEPQPGEVREEQPLRIKLVKNKNGANGSVTVTFYEEKAVFAEKEQQ